MPIAKVSANDFQQEFETLCDKARREPIVITDLGRDSLIVISAEEWQRLKRRDRHVGLTAKLSEEWVEAICTAKVPDERTT